MTHVSHLEDYVIFLLYSHIVEHKLITFLQLIQA